MIAYVVGRMMGNPDAQSVFDCSLSVQTGFSGRISETGIFMLDLQNRRRIVGQRSANRISISYDTEQMDLVMKEDKKTFMGFDVESKHLFRGSVRGSSVTLFDEEEKQDYTFTL